ncbi:SRPBCC domain-containing protein [Nonomuraea candida]|uniref:SRPBCC domain-containing protein n=1 Tax=Nonomuraea candida TaxID=359159 RepID=UPI0005BA55E9|nr:SRPBCC domain-containing protein [Nonomuraea candida]
MRHRISTQIDIPAGIDDVWHHLIGIEAYAQWNPFIVRAGGDVEVGGRLEMRMEPPGGSAMTFRPRITELTHIAVLEWLGHLGVPGVFDGRHRFELHAVESGTRLIHSETFSGVLVPFLRRTLDGPTRAGFLAMNEALAERVAKA